MGERGFDEEDEEGMKKATRKVKRRGKTREKEGSVYGIFLENRGMSYEEKRKKRGEGGGKNNKLAFEFVFGGATRRKLSHLLREAIFKRFGLAKGRKDESEKLERKKREGSKKQKKQTKKKFEKE